MAPPAAHATTAPRPDPLSPLHTAAKALPTLVDTPLTGKKARRLVLRSGGSAFVVCVRDADGDPSGYPTYPGRQQQPLPPPLTTLGPRPASTFPTQMTSGSRCLTPRDPTAQRPAFKSAPPSTGTAPPSPRTSLLAFPPTTVSVTLLNCSRAPGPNAWV